MNFPRILVIAAAVSLLPGCKFAANQMPASSTVLPVAEATVAVQVGAKALDVVGTSVYDLNSDPEVAAATYTQNNQNFVVNSEQLIVLNVPPVPGLSTDFVFQSATRKTTLHVEVAIAEQHAALPVVWGANPNANLILTGSNVVTMSPVLATSTALQFKQLAAGASHACGLVSTGTAYCWGEGDDGRLGSNTTTDTAVPVALSTALQFKFIAASPAYWNGDRAHSCAIALTGKVYCWGKNTYGQLGNGTTTSSLVPVAINSTERFTSLSLGANFSCGVTETNSVYCWGRSDHGQMGQGNLLTATSPVQVAGTYANIAVGNDAVCAIQLASKHLYCWGHQDPGATAYIPDYNATTVDDNMPYRYVPTLFNSSRTYIQISGGASSFCAIDSTNDAYCWGHEMYGRLGITSLKEFYAVYYVPQKVVGTTKWKSISVGVTHSIGIDSDDDVWVWGQNDGGGVLGVGFETTSPTLPREGPYGFYEPRRINDSSKYSAVYAGGNYGLGIRK